MAIRPLNPVPWHALQPVPLWMGCFSISSGVISRSRKWYGSGFSSITLQFLQITLTSLCAIMACIELATRNGLTPISIRRVIALGASLVCKVLKTRCPVSAACTAVSATIPSRISPMSIILGACRSIALRILSNVNSISSLTWH